jgi:Alginate lyase/Carbohydrate binding module (family 35)
VPSARQKTPGLRRWGAGLVAAVSVAFVMVASAPANAATTRYEAENATISQGVLETLHTGYSGAGYVDSDNVVGSYVQFTISAASAGTATITIRYANGTTVDRPSTVTVNGTAVATAMSFPATADWNTWANGTVTAAVSAGSNTVRITATTANGLPNLDYIDVAVAPALNPNVSPGGNFDLSTWELQLPIGSPGSPTTILPAQLEGANGYSNPAYFWTDKTDGSMTFWDPGAGVTTQNSDYARSELREMNADGSAANWPLSGTHKLSATLRIVSVTKSVCVGQVHLGTGGSSTKPLLELYYAPSGAITLGTENSPAGDQTRHSVGTVALGTQWSYVIEVSGNTITLTINGTTTTYSIPSSFDAYNMYFKAGDYNQSSSSSTTNGAKVKFYALTASHSS